MGGHKKLSQLKNKLFERTVTLKPRRGSIYDRYGRELAISIPSLSLFADPYKMSEPYWAGKKLAPLLDIPKKKLIKKLIDKKRRFVWLKRHLSQRQAQQIKSWGIKGLYFIKESQRFYPNESSLSQVLGFTGVEGQGLEGVEKQYDSALKGETQKILIQRDARGRPLFMDFSPFISKVSGFDVHLTIDSDLQFYVEKGLQRAVARSQAESAVAIVLLAKNSEVLAMANIPNYNPNQPKKSPLSYRRNRAVTDMFEPGSALKTFTVISALQKGLSPTELYSSHQGRLKIGQSVITEADEKKKFKAQLNMSEILALSSNVGAGSIALKVGPEALRKTLSRFGFGEKTGLDFPGEAKGILRPLPWRKIETATIGFGHGIAGTALQVANAYATIARGGELKKPFLVKKIRNPYTNEEKHFKGQSLRRVLTPETARSIALLLLPVTEEKGTGSKAAVPGYFVAGKTGTAQKVDFKNKGYKKGEYISSFAGFIPAHKPQFVIYLMIDGAKDNFYASSLAAPLFSQIASYAVRRAGLSPAVLDKKLVLNNREKDLPLKSAQRETAGLKPIPKAGGPALNSLLKNSGERSLVPNLIGLSLREVLNQTQGQGWKLKIYGSGWLTQTKPSVGEPLLEGKTLHLIFN